MNLSQTTQFKAEALSWDTLRHRAPSIFAPSPMLGVSDRYAFVPTARIVAGLREANWVAVDVEEQRIRQEKRRGFQKHLIRFRLAAQIESLDEWNIELVLVNSHDGGCAYQLHAGIYRRICPNGLVVSDGGFEALRFRHSGLSPEIVVMASLRLMDALPYLAGRIFGFRSRMLEPAEALAFADRALRLRYSSDVEPPVSPATLLEARRTEDQGSDLWHTLNRVAGEPDPGRRGGWPSGPARATAFCSRATGHRLQGGPEQGALEVGRAPLQWGTARPDTDGQRRRVSTPVLETVSGFRGLCRKQSSTFLPFTAAPGVLPPSPKSPVECRR